MKTKQRRLPRRVREQQLIDAAVTAFSRGDYHTVSVEEIAEAAGTSKPTVYHYLGSKEGIFTACVRREMERLIEAVRAAVHDPSAPLGDDPLRRGMQAFFTFVVENRESWTVLYRRAAVQGEPFEGETTRMRDRVTAEVAELIEACTRGDYGALEPKDAQLLARIAVSTADAFTDWLLEHPDETPDAMAGHVTELTWSHLRAQEKDPVRSVPV
ncbi:TetR/AcrR family transcriptional regulator [Nocardiopsis ganjiahuensis]|uniref:TetR/AcrR family transcriptional regulator n=1 Tax=Nocardiopsis ganjiahuensis TaxID=239984 RepID=UPI000345FD42|nr:TetR/AcrR family transcriptional regulator [Nocardiopsis ganjiahuensis]